MEFRRYFAEFVVVVLGILLAFMLNSWWMSVKDGHKKASYLEQISADLEHTVSLVKEARAEQNRRLYATSKLLSAAFMDSLPPDEVLNRLAYQSMSYETGALISTTLSSLIQSGDLQLIEEDSLRNELVNLAEVLEDYEKDKTAIGYQMVLEGFKEFSAEINPVNLIAHVASDSLLDLQTKKDSLFPMPPVSNLKRRAAVDWSEELKRDDLVNKITYLYIAHQNLANVHDKVLVKLEKSTEKLKAYGQSSE